MLPDEQNRTSNTRVKFRVTIISEQALLVFIYESFIDNQNTYFDVSDKNATGEPSIVTTFDIDWDTREFICVARNDLGNYEKLQIPGIDTKPLLSNLKHNNIFILRQTLYRDFLSSNCLIYKTASQTIIQN